MGVVQRSHDTQCCIANEQTASFWVAHLEACTV